MASREEEKQRRREERLAREKATADATARRKRLQYVFGGLLAVAAVAGIVAVAAIGLGGSESDAEPGSPSDADTAGVTLPEQKIGDLKAAAKAAGCELKSPELEPAEHETKTFTAADYKTNPPTSGNHTPDWYEDGIYEPGNSPELGKTVHTLEHGRIDVQYRPGTSPEAVKQLEALLGEQNGGYHMLLFQNETKMPYAVAATAWGQMLGCKTMSPAVFDALRTFTREYVDKGPESVP